MKGMRLSQAFLVCGLVSVVTGCGAEDDSVKGSPVTLRGRVEAIDESRVSWDQISFALVCEATLKEGGKVVYQAGDEYRTPTLGPDHSFEIDLPGELEAGWYGSGAFDKAGCALDFRVYNDQNSNGKLDVAPIEDPGAYEDPQELLCDNSTGKHICGVQFIRDPEFYQKNLGVKMAVGWNYMVGLKEWSSDFDREFVLSSLNANP